MVITHIYCAYMRAYDHRLGGAWDDERLGNARSLVGVAGLNTKHNLVSSKFNVWVYTQRCKRTEDVCGVLFWLYFLFPEPSWLTATLEDHFFLCAHPLIKWIFHFKKTLIWCHYSFTSVECGNLPLRRCLSNPWRIWHTGVMTKKVFAS